MRLIAGWTMLSVPFFVAAGMIMEAYGWREGLFALQIMGFLAFTVIFAYLGAVMILNK